MFTLKDAAKQLNVPYSTVFNRVRWHQLPTIKLGSYHLIDLDILAKDLADYKPQKKKVTA